MNWKQLLEESEIRKISAKECRISSLPKDGDYLLQGTISRRSADFAAYPRCSEFSETLHLTSYPDASALFYGDRRIRLLVWPGDLVIHADLIDDDFEMLPELVVKGNLTARNWLRGGMSAFIGGDVQVSGFVAGHYNDSALFVGGDLNASGYIHRAKPYVDLPQIFPHQIAGKVNARTFEALDASDEALTSNFVEEALTQDEEGFYLNEKAVIERSTAGLPVWR